MLKDPKLRNEAKGERTPHAHRSSSSLQFDNLAELVSKTSITSQEKGVNISYCVPGIAYQNDCFPLQGSMPA